MKGKPVLTFHELPPWLGAGGGYGERQLVDGDPVGHRQGVDPLIGRFAGEQLPKQHAVTPHVARLGEGGVLDDFGSHPRVGARLRHPRRLVHLPGQAEIRDLQGFEL